MYLCARIHAHNCVHIYHTYPYTHAKPRRSHSDTPVNLHMYLFSSAKKQLKGFNVLTHTRTHMHAHGIGAAVAVVGAVGKT